MMATVSPYPTSNEMSVRVSFEFSGYVKDTFLKEMHGSLPLVSVEFPLTTEISVSITSLIRFPDTIARGSPMAIWARRMKDETTYITYDENTTMFENTVS